MADLIDMKRSESGRKTTCWLVWSISSRTGLTAIRAIASTQKIAMRYVKGVKQSPDCIKAWAESRDIDHLYAETEASWVNAIDRRDLHNMAAQLPLKENP